MAIINELAVKELKEIYFTEYGVKLGNKDATVLANHLLILFKILFAINDEACKKVKKDLNEKV